MHLGQSINYHAPDNNAAIIDFVILFARFVYIVILLIGNVIYHQKFTFLQAIPFAVQTIQGRVQCCFKVISPPIAKKHFSRHIKELIYTYEYKEDEKMSDGKVYDLEYRIQAVKLANGIS